MTVPSVPFSIPKKILLPVDFSVSSEAALEAATELALYFHAELYLLHVIPVIPDVVSPDFPAAFAPSKEFLDQARRNAMEKLARYAAKVVPKGIRTDFAAEVGDDIASAIQTVIERERINLLVLSTHGLSGWRAVVFGSIAESTLRKVQCPVLLLQAPKRGISQNEVEHARTGAGRTLESIQPPLRSH